MLLRGKSSGLFAEMWANGTGHELFEEYRKRAPLSEAHCTRDGCDITVRDTHIHVSHKIDDIKRGCPEADTWISGYYIFAEERTACSHGMQFIDRKDFDKNGSYWGWFTQRGVRWNSTNDEQGQRPWSVGL